MTGNHDLGHGRVARHVDARTLAWLVVDSLVRPQRPPPAPFTPRSPFANATAAACMHAGPDGKTKKLLLCLGAGGFAATLDGIKVVAGQRVPVAIKHVAMDKRSAGEDYSQ